MSDDIELIIKRDLNRLPVLPEERWVPTAPPSPWVLTWSMRAAALATAVAFALALGLALVNVRDRIGTAAATGQPTMPSATSPASPGVVSRQSVLAHVRGLSAVIPRAQRFEAKLLSSADVPTSLASPTGSLFWLVAVSGDVNCIRCAVPPPQPFHSAVFLMDAHTGNVVASELRPAFWPDGFDALPDRSRSAGSRSLVGMVVTVSGNMIEFQSAESPERLRLVADENTAYSWAAGLAGGSALTLDEVQGRLGLLAGVTFDSTARPDGTFRLEALRTGVATK